MNLLGNLYAITVTIYVIAATTVHKFISFPDRSKQQLVTYDVEHSTIHNNTTLFDIPNVININNEI